MKLKPVFSILALLLLMAKPSFAQREYYTLLQGGANIGVKNPGFDGNFNGYSLHFIFGRNYNERAFLGIGLGNEVLRGDYKFSEPKEGQDGNLKYDRNLFPIFIDARLPFAYIGDVSRVGALANAGYAVRLGGIYDKGAMGKLGLFYLYDNEKRTNFTISASYAYQQLNYVAFREKMNHQSLNLSVGIWLK
ncbi:hypothetical protein GQF61_16660 [Sphingobacterium sp. DK4209]|uniref:Outer membrane beta-barrel protein n=1 Tax=Sphingobacterium zhuxiongii TaxID=2662364 RepID=A0A5Q0QGX1_9SPHI|nr:MULTISPECIES: hypothetical protein [unclassified Sphingobacterium]MVZ67486.1 hypothetical protein [Sphingobacterium sp. DK4209]QGA27228.1 hypothetical protein GFH32_13320 [Sphingobacterium sp. dk4302]